MELNLSDLPGHVIRTALMKIVENKLKTKKYKLKVSSASKAGENNFVGVVYRVCFSNEDESVTSKLILKVAPQNESRRIFFWSRQCFLQEIYLYSEVFIVEFQMKM